MNSIPYHKKTKYRQSGCPPKPPFCNAAMPLFQPETYVQRKKRKRKTSIHYTQTRDIMQHAILVQCPSIIISYTRWRNSPYGGISRQSDRCPRLASASWQRISGHQASYSAVRRRRRKFFFQTPSGSPST